MKQPEMLSNNPQAPIVVGSGRLVRLPRRVSTWLRKWKKNEEAKRNALRRQDFEAAAAYIKMKRAFADLICSELVKQPNAPHELPATKTL